jgi:hypothetical protein
MSMIPDRPIVRLRAAAAQQQARYDRIDAYLELRWQRRRRDHDRERTVNQREAERFVPCALCGGQTDPWDRIDRHPSIVICSGHHRRMSGRFPFGRQVGEADVPREIREPLFVARTVLHNVEQAMKEMAHDAAY